MKRYLIKMLAFILLGLVLFFDVQKVLQQKGDNLYEERMYSFEAIENDTIDVLFLGTSLIAYGISPMRLYENTGITSYNLGLSMGSLDCAYFYLKWALQTQSPSVVMVDASALCMEVYSDSYSSENSSIVVDGFTSNAARAILLDCLPFGSVKYEMAKDLVENIPMWDYDYIETISPIIRYHSRWTELNSRDFSVDANEFLYSMGAFIYANVMPGTVDAEENERIIDEMESRNEGKAERYFDGKMERITIDKALYIPTITEEGIRYLKAIQELCQSYGAEMVLIKPPTMRYPQIAAWPWNEDISTEVRELARELDIQFYDFALDYNIVDFQTDTTDSGMHLNIRGVEKFTDALGRVLQTAYHCQSKMNKTYDEMLPIYQKFRRVAMLESELDFDEYLQMLNKYQNDWTIVISAFNEYTGAMRIDEYEVLANGLHLGLIANGEYTDSYIAVIDAGDVVLEEVSNRRITENVTVNKIDIGITSSGYYSNPAASIEINGEEYAQNSGGLNIVVIDNETARVIDSVAFDTQQVTKPCYRSWDDTGTYLRAYEQSLLGKTAEQVGVSG